MQSGGDCLVYKSEKQEQMQFRYKLKFHVTFFLRVKFKRIREEEGAGVG